MDLQEKKLSSKEFRGHEEGIRIKIYVERILKSYISYIIDKCVPY